MNRSRREMLGRGLRLTGLGLADLGLSRLGLGAFAAATSTALRAQTADFTRDPFTLGIASGFPQPDAIVLWTRLAPEPRMPDGGMSKAAVAVDWELASDPGFLAIARSGRAHATPEWAHSVHVEVAGLEPGRDYWYRFRAGGHESPIGRTRTAPAPGAAARRLRIGLACCQHYENGHYAAYRAMAEDDLDLVVHVGDYIYENRGVARVRSHAEPEARTLDDYRRRYALYKSDRSLQQAHANLPWMVTWDDHEVDNDYADWHSLENEAAALFLARRAAAYKAYYEHMPLPRRALPSGAHLRLHGRQSFGGLVDVYMLDGRQYRSDQACGEGRIAPCAELYERERTMLGRAQAEWLDASLARGRARWTVLAQQTVFAQMDQGTGSEVRYWSDGWSGYPAARARLLESLATHAAPNPVVLSGDVHAFLVNDVHARSGEYDSAIVATEFVTSSISSLGPPQPTVDAWRARNANVRLARSDRRGYTRITIEPDALTADLIAVDDVAREDSGTHTLASFTVEDGRPGVAR